MSRLRPFTLKCVAVILAAQFVAVPVNADGISISSGGVIVVGSKSSGILRSKHRVQRYYVAPRAHHHKARPKVHYVKPVKRHRRLRLGHHSKRQSPYYIPQKYGIQHRNYHRRGLRHRY